MNWILYVALGFLGGLAVGSYTGDRHCKKPGASSPRSEKVSHAPQEKKVAFGQGQTSSKD